MEKNSIFLGLGTNQGDKIAHLTRAISIINEQIGEIIHISSIYESEPWGFESSHIFYNLVLECSTSLSPFALLEKTEEIEQIIGKKKTIKGNYTDRNIDIDILFYNDLKIKESHLTIPHPHIWERDFVYIPLLEIYPNSIKKKPKKTILTSQLRKISEQI